MKDLLVATFTKYTKPREYPVPTVTPWGRERFEFRFIATLSRSFSLLLQSREKRMPSFAKDPDETFYKWVAGIFDSEGTVGIYSDRKGEPRRQLRTYIEISNTSETLIGDLAYELRRRGYPINVRTRQKPGFKREFVCRIFEREAVSRFIKTVPFLHPEKKAVARFILKNFGPNLNRLERIRIYHLYSELVNGFEQDRDLNEALAKTLLKDKRAMKERDGGR